MFLSSHKKRKPFNRLPHAGGGVSNHLFIWCRVKRSSPRRWGCFSQVGCIWTFFHVFPTQVGVFPKGLLMYASFCCLPHAGGGVSIVGITAPRIAMSSPRRWGCFPTARWSLLSLLVFPTQVGVFLCERGCRSFLVCLPHAGGGVS